MADELVAFLRPLVRHPRALGLDVSIYDPALDPDRSCARRLVSLLESLLTCTATELARDIQPKRSGHHVEGHESRSP